MIASVVGPSSGHTKFALYDEAVSQVECARVPAVNESTERRIFKITCERLLDDRIRCLM